jgi:acetyl esterase/lipase
VIVGDWRAARVVDVAGATPTARVLRVTVPGWPGSKVLAWEAGPASSVPISSGVFARSFPARASRNRFVDLLEAGGVPRERLTWLAGEQFGIVGSDQRSFALLAARFPDPPAGEMFLSLAQGELQALRLLSDFAGALEWRERDLRAYEPRPLAQASNGYLEGTVEDDPLVIPANSPALLARFPPTLLLTSTRDFAMSNTIQSHRLLTNAGVTGELHVWDGLWHGFMVDSRLPESQEAYRVIARFFDRELAAPRP